MVSLLQTFSPLSYDYGSFSNILGIDFGGSGYRQVVN
jgi:hypothetical protein